MAVTALALLLWGAPESAGQEPVPGLDAVESPLDAAAPAEDRAAADSAPASAAESVEEATGTIRDLAIAFYGLLPKLGIALALLVLAGILSRLVRPLLGRMLRSWERAEATGAMVGVLIWLLALGAALSVIAGDARALLGSVGLLGLALSWALQGPIESFSGWLLNSFRGYYRTGDRIAVGEVLGDVYRIDFLTTTVWEVGGPDKPVQGAQPTGALITFPNSEILRANVINYTRDFPFVWDELTVGVSNESDLEYAIEVVQRVAAGVVGQAMAGPASAYARLLASAGLDGEVSPEPQVYVSPAEAWTEVTVRYLVAARERRRWSSQLLVTLSAELARAEHRGRIGAGYPRRQVELVGADPPG